MQNYLVSEPYLCLDNRLFSCDSDVNVDPLDFGRVDDRDGAVSSISVIFHGQKTILKHSNGVTSWKWNQVNKVSYARFFFWFLISYFTDFFQI